jgi:hypothetical protein
MRDNEQRARGYDSAVIEAIDTKRWPSDIQHHDDVSWWLYLCGERYASYCDCCRS